MVLSRPHTRAAVRPDMAAFSFALWSGWLLLILVTMLPASAFADTAWRHLVDRVMRQPTAARHEAINLAINQFEHADATGPTVWQTPAELIARGIGDCKDFALAKFWLLRHIGTPRQQVRLGYGHWQSGDDRRLHLVVLLWVDGGSPLVLDNLVSGIHRLSDRRDLDIRFSFDESAFYEQVGLRPIADQPLRGWAALRSRLPAPGLALRTAGL